MGVALISISGEIKHEFLLLQTNLNDMFTKKFIWQKTEIGKLQLLQK